MKQTFIITSLIACLLGVAYPTSAQEVARKDVLLIDRVDSTGHVNTPKKGTIMSTVESQYGTPQDKSGPVGNPPITSWVYDQFTVYFEYQHVIHAVVNRASEYETRPEAG